ncbi:MAG: toprim domain-containing protein, partial [Melioribacteraceae bacterium]
AIPVHNEKNKIVAYVGRAVNDTKAEAEGKYKIPVNFLKSLEVFNLNRVLAEPERIEKYGLIIVESYFSVFWLWQLGFKNVTSIMGWSISDVQIEKYLEVSQKLTVFLDGDKTGREATEKIVERLSPHAFIRAIHYPDGPKRKPTHFDKKELSELLKIKTLSK